MVNVEDIVERLGDGFDQFRLSIASNGRASVLLTAGGTKLFRVCELVDLSDMVEDLLEELPEGVDIQDRRIRRAADRIRDQIEEDREEEDEDDLFEDEDDLPPNENEETNPELIAALEQQVAAQARALAAYKANVTRLKAELARKED